MPGETCNVALVGTKFMGRAHSNAFLKVAKFFDVPLEPVMHSVVARNAEETKAFADRWGWQNNSTDLNAVVTNPEIDLVDIVTPNNVHAENAIAALEAGKHVACEKPLANTLDNARQMAQAVRTHWTIENQLHWVLDVVMNEDQARAGKDNAPENLVLSRRLALNIFKRNTGKVSNRIKIKRAGWDNRFLRKLIAEIA